MKVQRKYNVIFRDIKTKDERTVQVTTTDSINASNIVYANFGGRKKIKVILGMFGRIPII